MRLRIEEALMLHNSKADPKIRIIDLGFALWPDSQESAQKVNVSKLVNGKTVRVEIAWIKILCEKLECSPNFLCGFSENKFDW